MKIGIFGGTFNPPHNTHVNIALQAKSQLALDKLFVVPCGLPPHKPCEVDKRVRLRLTSLAFSGIADVWDYEINKSDTSYTVETLKEAKRLYPDALIYLIIGGDSLLHFNSWYKPEQIAKMCVLAVAARKNVENEKARKNVIKTYGAEVEFLDVEPNGISSTEIRLRYQFGLSNADSVPLKVDDYILASHAYSQYSSMIEKLKKYLSSERFNHTFYVVKRGLELANDGEKDKVFIACLLHDCAKHIAPRDYARYGFVKPDDMPQSVVHSFLGAKVACMDFGVTDNEILDAITYHTTGRPDMTRLDKIVYVADKTEQTRPYPLEHLLEGTLDEKFVACLKEAYQVCLESHCDSVCPLSEQTLAFYCPQKN